MGLNKTPARRNSENCRWLVRLWLALSVAWIAFVGWRTHAGWPAIPLDMGGADAARDAVFQAALVRHAGMALGLAIGAPAVSYILGRIACRLLRR